MFYEPFHQYFPDLASKETRCVTTFSNNDFGLPADEYGLVESFCNEKKCDCRRTMLMVISRKSKSQIAVINFGWESRQFYAKWLGANDKSEIDELKGPSLNLMSPQSKYAGKILEMVCSTALKDENYIERIKQHYKLFKDKINSKKK